MESPFLIDSSDYITDKLESGLEGGESEGMHPNPSNGSQLYSNTSKEPGMMVARWVTSLKRFLKDSCEVSDHLSFQIVMAL